MALEGFQHLVSIIFKPIGDKEAIAASQKVREEIKRPWDTKRTELGDLEKNIRKTMGVSGEEVKKFGKEAGKLPNTFKKNKTVLEEFGLAMKRALIVAPAWMTMRASINLVLGTIKSVLDAFLQLEAGMSKLQAVMAAQGNQQKAVYDELAQAAMQYFVSSSASMAQITAAMYELGSAGRSTAEILNGFQHVLNLSIATYGDATQASKILAGILNVYGDNMTEQITNTEKMKYISDLLTHTWAKEQVELDEIQTAMSYVGAAGKSLNIDLDLLVRTIGFLNTGLLKGSKAGVSLFQAFSQIAKNQDKLRDLGIAFDPRKPLDFFEIMQQLQRIYGDTNSLEAHGELIDVFGDRAVRSISQIIQNWDRWRESIKRGDEEFQGFAERTKNTAEKTLPAAFGKFMKLAFFPTEAAGVAPGLTGFFNKINEEFIKSTKIIEDYQKLVKEGLVPPITGLERIPLTNVEDRLLAVKRFAKELEQTKPLSELMGLLGADEILTKINTQTEQLAKNAQTAGQKAENIVSQSIKANQSFEVMLQSRGKELALLLNTTQEQLKQKEALQIVYSERLKLAQLNNQQQVGEVKVSSELKKQIKDLELANRYELLKAAGKEEEEIILAKIADKVTDLNDLTKEENERRKSSGQELFKQVNLTDVLAGKWEKILNLGMSILDNQKDIIPLEQLRNRLIEERIQKQQQEKTDLESLLFQFAKADIFEKGRIKREIEIQTLPEERIVSRFKEAKGLDKDIILKNIQQYSSEIQAAIAKTIASEAGISEYSRLLQKQQFVESAQPSLFRAGPQAPISTDVSINVGNITGAIDNDSLQKILNKIEEKVKQSPAYIDNNIMDTLLHQLEKDEGKQKKLGKLLSNDV